jgi:L-Ala-D/L-Glu epimerase
MKITEVKARLIAVPRRDTLRTSYGTRSLATTVLVEVFTDEGITGIGQASVDGPYYGESAAGMLANIRAHTAPAAIGENPLNIERVVAKLHKALPHHYASMAGIELALWDLKGKALGVPVYQLLGGKVRDGVAIMGFVHHDTPSNMQQHVHDTLAEQPFPVLKMKIGLDPVEDVVRYRAVAEAVAGRAVIQVDGNVGYTLGQAIPALAAMERIGGLGAVEQPVARLDDLAELARRLSTPIMADEAIYPPADAIDIVRHRAAQIALMKITKHGGILAVHKIAAIFEAAGMSLSIAIYYDLIGVAAAHIAAATPCVTWPSPHTYLADTILTEPFEPDGLLLRVPEGPGFGVQLDPYKVEKYRVELG